MKPARAATRRYLPGSPFNTPPVVRPVPQYALNDQVTHDRYGLGVVIAVEDEVAVLVDFGTQREPLTAPYANLTRRGDRPRSPASSAKCYPGPSSARPV